MTEAYPLAWPEGWPRTPADKQLHGWAKFKRPTDNGRYLSNRPWTFGAARDSLLEEIWKHKPQSVVLSSNFTPGKNGPQEGRRRPEDQGVAIYFQRQGKPYVMACDRYGDAEGNFRSLALALEAMRQLERHGGGVMMERAYEGFAALPAPKRWWEILGVSAQATLEQVERAWRELAAEHHPDRSGSHERMAEINAARAEARKALG